MPHGRGKGGGRGRGGRGAYYTPQVKRVRVPSEEQEESDVEVDPELLLDSLLACLTKKESLLDRFLTHLLQVPSLQDKIAQMVMSSFVTDSSSGDEATANAAPNSTTADGSIKTSIANNFMSTIKDLTSAVNELKTELKSSTQRCDDLEQYSRRNNIIIANVPESEVTSTEGQVVNILNDYVDEAITPNDIDRCHRLKRNSKTNGVSQQKPSDIIVKFVSHKSVASILTKDPMEKLRANNLLLPEKSRIYIREDLTKKRASVLYKARQLKKAKLIKDAFSRDGSIIIRMPPNSQFGRDIYDRITCEDELKKFCIKNKLKVNSECLPLTMGKQKSSFASIVLGAAGSSASGSGAPKMDSHDTLTGQQHQSPAAQLFQHDDGTIDEVMSPK